MDVLVIHYNTPRLTEAAIRSLQSVTKCNVFVFDNSDEHPFTASMEGVEVIDNTKGQVIDFDEMLSAFPRKVENRSSWGSAKHCKSVDMCFDILKDGFLLMDSDVLIKKDVSPLFDNSSAWVGGIHTNTRKYGHEIIRVIPWLCYINVPMLAAYGIRYFNPDKMWFLSDKEPNMYYDTGAWLYEKTMSEHLHCKLIWPEDYCIHLGHGSWKEKDTEKWLNENERLWRY